MYLENIEDKINLNLFILNRIILKLLVNGKNPPKKN